MHYNLLVISAIITREVIFLSVHVDWQHYYACTAAVNTYVITWLGVWEVYSKASRFRSPILRLFSSSFRLLFLYFTVLSSKAKYAFLLSKWVEGGSTVERNGSWQTSPLFEEI
jgi:hypothetical protein